MVDLGGQIGEKLEPGRLLYVFVSLPVDQTTTYSRTL